ncbi:CLUMA_CG014301, isoform A [Clunio marinus]|uniref:CLUMA_CG014301, isoform A n=1 Tax=Clunio marinus TaxID=568069 RepID=A0A1J1IQL5_9DIPT|nr:CLUMA_CG014301, isoform A [Clunio marinus]
MFKFLIAFVIFTTSSAYNIPTSFQKVVVYRAPSLWEPKEESWKDKTYWAPEPKVDAWAPKVESWAPKVESWAPKVEWKEPEAPANYDFKYEVHDEKTGDLKRQSETAKNGAVKGQYSLIDSDGFKRIVDYTADDIHGFQATVKREPTHYKIPIPAPKPEWSKPEAEKWW